MPNTLANEANAVIKYILPAFVLSYPSVLISTCDVGSRVDTKPSNWSYEQSPSWASRGKKGLVMHEPERGK